MIVSPVSYTKNSMRSNSTSKSLKFNIGLIDLVDQQNNLLLRREGFPELAALDVLADVLGFTVTQLRVPS